MSKWEKELEHCDCGESHLPFEYWRKERGGEHFMKHTEIKIVQPGAHLFFPIVLESLCIYVCPCPLAEHYQLLVQFRLYSRAWPCSTDVLCGATCRASINSPRACGGMTWTCAHRRHWCDQHDKNYAHSRCNRHTAWHTRRSRREDIQNANMYSGRNRARREELMERPFVARGIACFRS